MEPAIQPEPVIQPAPVYLTDDEMLQWIITRESHGDPYATNGKYKGIGQLDESYYPTYVGMTWAECEGNYDIQLEAMLGYIASRYGSIQEHMSSGNGMVGTKEELIVELPQFINADCCMDVIR